MTNFDYEHAEYHFGINEAGWGIERWFLDGEHAWCLEAVGLISTGQITEAGWRTITAAEAARLNEYEEANP